MYSYAFVSAALLPELLQIINLLGLTYYPMVHRLATETRLQISLIGADVDRYLPPLAGMLTSIFSLMSTRDTDVRSRKRYMISGLARVKEIVSVE